MRVIYYLQKHTTKISTERPDLSGHLQTASQPAPLPGLSFCLQEALQDYTLCILLSQNAILI